MTELLITIRKMNPGDEQQVSALVREIFNQFVAPLCAQNGVKEFFRYIDPGKMAKRAQRNHFMLLAEVSGELAGVLEMRDFKHISLLFVASEVQRRGIARQLLAEAVKIAREQEPELSTVSVNSSPNAVLAYEKLGFRATGSEKEENGLRFTPMILQLK